MCVCGGGGGGERGVERGERDRDVCYHYQLCRLNIIKCKMKPASSSVPLNFDASFIQSNKTFENKLMT